MMSQHTGRRRRRNSSQWCRDNNLWIKWKMSVDFRRICGPNFSLFCGESQNMVYSSPYRGPHLVHLPSQGSPSFWYPCRRWWGWECPDLLSRVEKFILVYLPTSALEMMPLPPLKKLQPSGGKYQSIHAAAITRICKMVIPEATQHPPGQIKTYPTTDTFKLQHFTPWKLLPLKDNAFIPVLPILYFILQFELVSPLHYCSAIFCTWSTVNSVG